jgi:hypothetical protein
MNKKDCWVSPGGTITWTPFGLHSGVAYDIIDENGWSDEYEKWDVDNKGVYYPTDFLQDVKGYIRYMDWGKNPGWRKGKTLTDAQARIIMNFRKIKRKE